MTSSADYACSLHHLRGKQLRRRRGFADESPPGRAANQQPTGRTPCVGRSRLRRAPELA